MDEKAVLRRRMLAIRDAETARQAKSWTIQQRCWTLPEFTAAETWAAYVGVRSEVATQGLILEAIQRGKRLGVVYRAAGDLGICLLESLADLALAGFGLWEPPARLQADPARRCPPTAVDLFVIPGLAFDHEGARLGYGKGYYDRLLRQARPDAHLVALAYESQIVERVPTTAQDQKVGMLVTERAVYRRSP